MKTIHRWSSHNGLNRQQDPSPVLTTAMVRAILDRQGIDAAYLPVEMVWDLYKQRTASEPARPHLERPDDE